MNRILILLIMLLPLAPAIGQDYFVLQVRGAVKRTKTGALIKTKDIIKADEQISFSSPSDAVAVVNAKSGRFIIKPGAPTKTNELFAYVKDALTQASSRLSTRNAGFNNVLDIKTFFATSVLLLPELHYKVNGESFPISEASFFFIQYQYKGEEINKQLPINADSLLIIQRSELFKIDGQPIPENETTDHQLAYYSNDGTISICPLKFNMAVPSKVREEVEILMQTLESSPNYSNKIWGEVIAYLNENYARVDEVNLKRWLKKK